MGLKKSKTLNIFCSMKNNSKPIVILYRFSSFTHNAHNPQSRAKEWKQDFPSEQKANEIHGVTIFGCLLSSHMLCLGWPWLEICCLNDLDLIID